MSWLRKVAQGYIEAACWSTVDTGENGEQEVFLDDVDLAPGQAMRLGLAVCRWARRFEETVDKAAALMDGRGGYDGYELVGHDAWLSQVGHGTGFWDREELERCEVNGCGREVVGGKCGVHGHGVPTLGDVLTEAAKTMGESAYGYVGDDGLGYFDGLA